MREGKRLTWSKGQFEICDYSLQHVDSRDARVGDELEVSAFHASITKGLADPRAPGVAVCVIPGTQLAFEEDITEAGTFFAAKHKHRTAKFIQQNMDNPYSHHDSIELPDGTKILLHNLCVGQKVKVLQLPAKPQTDAEELEQTRVAYV